MERRDFLRAVAMGATASALGVNATGCVATPGDPLDPAMLGLPEVTTGRDLWARMPSAFNRRIRRETPTVELGLLAGVVPTDMAGHVFFQSLSLLDSDAGFSGDSMIWRVDFDAPQPQVTSRLLRSSDFLLAEAVRGTPLEYESHGMGRIGPLGLQNQANTALVRMDGNRLLATVDAGRPWEIDPRTLNPITPVGRRDDYRPVATLDVGVNTPISPFAITSAHPPYDPHTGEFFGISFSLVPIPQMNFCEIHLWDGAGDLRVVPIVGPDGNPILISQSAHQLCLTRDYLVILDASITLELGKLVNSPNSWDAAQVSAPRPTSDIYIISRQKLRETTGVAVAQKCSIPRGSGHLMVDYENPGGRIVVHSGHTPAMDVGEWIMPFDKHPRTRDPVRPELVNCITPVSYDIGVVGRYEINPRTGRILEATSFFNDWTWGTGGLTARNPLTPDGTLGDTFHSNSGFPTDLAIYRAYQHLADYEYRVVPTRDLPWEGVPACIARIDHDAGRVVDGYFFDGDRFGWTVTFVPRHGTAVGSADGYLVATVFSDEATEHSAGTEIWIFDAGDLAAGPIAKLGRPDLEVPLTLHSVWLDSLDSSRPDYRIDVGAEMLERAATWTSHPFLESTIRNDVIPEFLAVAT